MDTKTAQRRIFVVDDETTIASTLALILNSHGFDAVPYTSPIDALRAAETHTPDLLLTDVSMPLMNGIDLAVQFKVIYPDCKVLLFSGNAATSGLMDTAMDEGHSFELLAKPVQPQDLIATIRSLLA